MATYLEIARAIRNQNAQDRIATGLLRTAAAVRNATPGTIDDYKTLVLAGKLVSRITEITNAMMPLAMLDATLRSLAGSLVADVNTLAVIDETTLETNIQRVCDAQFVTLARQLISDAEAKAKKG